MTKKPRLIGYVRVSRSKQNTDAQLDAMKAAGCQKMFQDKISGKRWQRKGLDAALAEIRPGDRLAVWRIDRLGRSIVPILTIIEELDEYGAAVISLSEACDTSTENGKIQAIFLAVVAHMEHSAIRKRTKAGVDAAALRGKSRGGRPKMTKSQVKDARQLMSSGRLSASATAARYNVGRATLFRHLRAG